ncbi:hypothetical protein Cni_G10970 [Canna indica]|uniref:Stigma-specific Stig1 family protein n=1 Tax=Canna indica TaxID=4628 RepID=A0AAQ3QAE2_9LILI|nr:hypothetical protein Cni_G10970 [Canna indica]
MAKKTFFIMAYAMALVILLLIALPVHSEEEGEELERAAATSSSLSRGINRLLAQYNPRSSMTCDKFPRVCRAGGSPGPDCCRKQCVNVMTDSRNCGQCGKKCRYGEACCGGKCVNVMYDPKNCGGCKKRCKKGSFCKYGMCSYA